MDIDGLLPGEVQQHHRRVPLALDHGHVERRVAGVIFESDRGTGGAFKMYA